MYKGSIRIGGPQVVRQLKLMCHPELRRRGSSLGLQRKVDNSHGDLKKQNTTSKW